MQSYNSNGQLTAQINLGDHKKSGFDLSNNVLGTGKIGRIIPTRALHVMPNDTIKADSKVAVQFEPLAVPILANMEVKQEHFYVPYNIVWKNWDKFISGGEKMDYDGVVPNITMAGIVTAFYQVFAEVNASPLGLPVKMNEFNSLNFDPVGIRWQLPDGSGEQTDYIEVYDALNSLGDKYKIKDLLKPCYEVLSMLDKISLTDDAVMFNKYMDVYEVISYFETANNKYLQQIKEQLIKFVRKYSDIYLPTRKCLELLQIIYEFYKPFIGIGSNIDYLNMNRLTFTDFLYSCIMEVNRYYVVDGDELDETFFVCVGVSSLSTRPMSVLNLRANYNIWYNNYRDILLEADAFEPVDTDFVSDEEIFVLLVPRQRCWEKDAFTTALDNPGTGNVGVPIGVNTSQFGGYMVFSQQPAFSGETDYADVNDVYRVSFGDKSYDLPTAFLSGINAKTDLEGFEYSGFSLYQLDAAQRAQKWLQKALFYGNRISDFYYMHFGVRFLDARLRLPELLTSSSELVKLDVVMNNTNITTEANGEIFQSIAGDRAAYASAYDNGNSFERYCEEHGVIMSFLTIMPQITYAYGSNRDYSRLDQFDFAFSEFATLGMDAVYDTEITDTPVKMVTNSNGVNVFGYQGKYYDYKAKHSEEHGELLDSQDMYTFARKFNMYDPDGRPKLNYEFVHCFPDLDMFVVDSTLADYFRYDIRHSTAAERNLPSQSIYI